MGAPTPEDHASERDTLGGQVNDLAAHLRSWRDRLTPDEPGRRRAPGLRRDEVAQRADVSVGYLTRLEQGHAAHPSPLVCGALARALELTAEETGHLYRLAGHAPPSEQRFDRTITPATQRLLDRFSDLPVMVYDPAWQIVAKNARAEALIGPGYGSVARRHFLGPGTYIQHTPEQHDAMSMTIVSDLHASLDRFPADERLHAIIDELQTLSPRFAELWDERPAAVHTSATKTIEHPEAGRLTLECDVLRVEGSDLRIVVYSAAPGTADAEAIARLGAAETMLSR
jgi:transcriptional regulator with XRE-family HTH domain